MNIIQSLRAVIIAVKRGGKQSQTIHHLLKSLLSELGVQFSSGCTQRSTSLTLHVKVSLIFTARTTGFRPVVQCLHFQMSNVSDLRYSLVAWSLKTPTIRTRCLQGCVGPSTGTA